MLSLSRFLEMAATITLDGVLHMTMNAETKSSFCVFYGTWKAFNTSKEQIICYLKYHPDIDAIWIAIDNDTELILRQKPFEITWVGLHTDGRYEVEVCGQKSDRIAEKWSGILSKILRGDVFLYWA